VVRPRDIPPTRSVSHRLPLPLTRLDSNTCLILPSFPYDIPCPLHDQVSLLVTSQFSQPKTCGRPSPSFLAARVPHDPFDPLASRAPVCTYLLRKGLLMYLDSFSTLFVRSFISFCSTPPAFCSGISSVTLAPLRSNDTALPTPLSSTCQLSRTCL